MVGRGDAGWLAAVGGTICTGAAGSSRQWLAADLSCGRGALIVAGRRAVLY
jgi:hypothetical protein